MEGIWSCESQPGLCLDPSSAAFWLCDLRQIPTSLCLGFFIYRSCVENGYNAARSNSCDSFPAGEPRAQGGEWSIWGTQQGAIILPTAEPWWAPLPFGTVWKGQFADFFSPWVKKQGQLQPGLWGWEVSGLLFFPCNPLKSHIRTALTLPDNPLPPPRGRTWRGLCCI